MVHFPMIQSMRSQSVNWNYVKVLYSFSSLFLGTDSRASGFVSHRTTTANRQRNDDLQSILAESNSDNSEFIWKEIVINSNFKIRFLKAHSTVTSDEINSLIICLPIFQLYQIEMQDLQFISNCLQSNVKRKVSSDISLSIMSLRLITKRSDYLKISNSRQKQKGWQYFLTSKFVDPECFIFGCSLA